MKKKNLNVLIIMIMLLGCILTGCTDRPPKEEGDKQALQMLEELYDDEFTLISSVQDMILIYLEKEVLQN